MEEILKQVESYIKDLHAKKRWMAGRDWVQYAGPYFGSEEYVAAVKTLLGEWLVLGNEATKFERKFPKYFGKKLGVLTNSGSSANLLMMSALTSKNGYNLPKGTKVICPVAGFPTTINPILQVGFTPIFVDIELKTLNLNLDHLEQACIDNPDAKVLTFAHVLGNPPDMDRVMEIVKKYSLILLEDCCDALNSMYDGKPLGSFGVMASCSFYPAHHCTTLGEGGFVAMNSIDDERIVRSFREWGRSCVTEETIVQTKEGYKEIKDVIIGDYVISHTGKWQRVYELTGRYYSGAMVKIGVNGKLINCTADHLFYIKRDSEYIWVEAKNVLTTDYFVSNNGFTMLHLMDSQYNYNEESIKVYNIEVEEDHSYHAFGVISHNCYCQGKSSMLENGTCGCRFSNWLPSMPEMEFDHKYVYDHIGYNLKPIEIQASVGLEQLNRIDDITEKRKHNYKKLYEVFSKYEKYFILHKATEKSDPNWFAFPITIHVNAGFTRSDICKFFEASRIQTRPYFAGNILLQPAYSDLAKTVNKSFPIATRVTTDTFFLGTAPVITDEKIDYISEILDKFIYSL